MVAISMHFRTAVLIICGIAAMCLAAVAGGWVAGSLGLALGCELTALFTWPSLWLFLLPETLEVPDLLGTALLVLLLVSVLAGNAFTFVAGAWCANGVLKRITTTQKGSQQPAGADPARPVPAQP